MATITLQDYYDNLEQLLSRNAYEEVIRHSRHIMQFYPKNANVFRFLGRALLESGETEEAGEIFRRLLGVYPDDFTAHVSLSKVYQKLNKPDEALWHLERAFEQDPNNQSLIDALRELYQRYRKVEQTKLQLTAAAVARQYVRNELYGQAIDVLQQAIDRSPERMDLRVLLAQTLWDGNQKLEAGEKALDVLETLPDCLVANRIMTELWLGEKRPSDAQRFLTHIEGVEPYLALELAKGQVSDSDLTIEELDYTRLAQQELAMASPDWLQDLGDLSDQGMEDEPSFHELPADPTQSAPDDDWLQTLQDASAEQTVNLTKDQLLAAKKAAAERAQATGANNEADWLSEMEETSKKPTSNLDGLFDDIPSSTSSTAGFTDFLDTLSTAPTERPAPSAEASEEVDDALDWLQQDVADKPVADPNDPLAWMRGSGIEIDEDAEAPSLTDPYGTDDELQLPAHDTQNPLAWLGGYDVEQPAPSASTVDADDPLAWLGGSDAIEEDDNPTVTPVVKPTPPPAAKPQPQTVSDDSLLDEMLHMEELSSTGSWEMPAVTDTSADDEIPDWLSDDTATEEPQAEAVDTPDWISGADMEATTDEDDALSWMDTAADEEEAPIAEADIPDWLSGSDLVEDDAPEAEADFSSMAWMNAPELKNDEETVTQSVEHVTPQSWSPGVEIPEDDEESAKEDALAWMEAASDEEEPVAQSDVPDWLSGSGFADDDVEDEPVAEEDPLAWMSAASAETPEEEPVAQSDVPDWLSGSGFADDEAEDEPVAEEDPLAWMSAASAETPEEEPVAQSDVPDWLSGGFADDDVEDEPVAEEDPLAWMSAASAETPDEEPVAQSDVPDWLSGSGFADEAEEEPVAEEDPLAWMNAASAETPEEEPVAEAETPDWLSEPAYVEDEMSKAEIIEEEADAEILAEADTPDWLYDSDTDEPEEAVVAEDDSLAWMDSTAEEQPEAVAEADMPDWLSAAPEQTEEPVAQAEDEPAWMTDDSQPEAAAAIITLSDEELPSEALEEGQTTMPDEQLPEELPIVEAQVAEGEATPLAEARDEDFVLGAPVTPEVLAQIEAEAAAAPPIEGAVEPIPALPLDDLDEIPAPPMETLPDLLVTPPDSDAPQEIIVEPSFGVGDNIDVQPMSSEIPEETEAAAAEASTPDWMSHPTTEEPAVLSFDDDADAEADTPDWLSSFADEQPISEEEKALERLDTEGGHATPLDENVLAAADAPDWSSEITFGDDDEAAAEADTPDWLSTPNFVDAEVSEEDAVAEADTPDWLSGSGFGDDEVEEEAAAEADTPDWLSTPNFVDAEVSGEEKAVAEDAPDWLSGVSYGDDETSDEEEAVAEDASSDWLSGVGFGDDEVEEEAVAEDAPDWLSGVGYGDEETLEEEQVEEAVAEQDTPDWLSEMSFDDSDEEAQPAASVEDDQALDWMAELDAVSSPSSSAEPVDQPEDLGWLDDDEQYEDDEPVIAQGNTDWLSSVGISKQETPVDQPEDFASDFSWAEDEDEQTADASSDMPSWAAEESNAEEEFDWASELTNDDSPTKSVREEFEVPSHSDEEYSPATAGNAPDWLNAMVPGLDVDPEEEEEAPIEQSYAEESYGHRVHASVEDQSGFGWLSDIVDEETSAQPAAAPSMMPEPVPDAPAPKPTKQPRFSFSRLPAWLRPKSASPAPTPAVEATAPAATSVTEEPDWLREADDTGDNSDNNDDFDMPDWLK